MEFKTRFAVTHQIETHVCRYSGEWLTCMLDSSKASIKPWRYRQMHVIITNKMLEIIDSRCAYTDTHARYPVRRKLKTHGKQGDNMRRGFWSKVSSKSQWLPQKLFGRCSAAMFTPNWECTHIWCKMDLWDVKCLKFLIASHENQPQVKDAVTRDEDKNHWQIKSTLG